MLWNSVADLVKSACLLSARIRVQWFRLRSARGADVLPRKVFFYFIFWGFVNDLLDASHFFLRAKTSSGAEHDTCFILVHNDCNEIQLNNKNGGFSSFLSDSLSLLHVSISFLTASFFHYDVENNPIIGWSLDWGLQVSPVFRCPCL